MIKIHTEKKAKEKICCKSIKPFDVDGVMCKCEASKCMAWRWGKGVGRLLNRGENSKGYCGLAGKP